MKTHTETKGLGRIIFRRRRRAGALLRAEILTEGSWLAQTNIEKARRIAKKNRDAVRWRVSDTEGGRRRRFYFPTEAQAQGKIEVSNRRLDNLGTRAANVDGRLMEDASEAHKMLEGFNVSLLTVVREYVARATAATKSRPVAEVVKEFIAERAAKGMSRFYISDLKLRLGRFAETFGEQMVSDIEPRDVDQWSATLNVSAVTVCNFLRNVSTMMGFAVRRGYCTSNPAAAVSKPKVVDTAPEVFTPAQVTALLKAAPAAAVPYFAVGAFAGLRPEEVKRLDWAQIDFDANVIEVSGRNSKTSRRRLVPVAANLRAWLLPHRETAGRVTPAGIRGLRQTAMKGARIKAWPVDVLRHSFVSFALARDQNLGKVALQAGHSETVLREHYMNLVKPADAVKFWSIMPPKKKGAKILKFKTAAA